MDGGKLNLTGHRGDGGHVVGGFGRHGVGHHAPVGDSGHVHTPQIDRRTGGDIGDDPEEEADVVDLLGDRQATAGPAFQPYCACLATGSGVRTLEILVPSG